MDARATETYRTYPHPHDPTVKVVDVLGPEGKMIRTFNRRWAEGERRGETVRKSWK